VRTLERTIGAVCRAVAVKVATHYNKPARLLPHGDETGHDAETTKVDQLTDDKKQKIQAIGDELVDTGPVSFALPPDMPIVIDQAAIEDILGVCAYSFYYAMR